MCAVSLRRPQAIVDKGLAEGGLEGEEQRLHMAQGSWEGRDGGVWGWEKERTGAASVFGGQSRQGKKRRRELGKDRERETGGERQKGSKKDRKRWGRKRR